MSQPPIQCTKYLEIEHKWDAEKVTWDQFIKYFDSLKSKYNVTELAVTGPDQYWRFGKEAPEIADKIAAYTHEPGTKEHDLLKRKIRRILREKGVGASVLRYRKSPNMHQLTVKKRTSKVSTTTREEADIEFLRSTPAADIESFLEMAGYAEDFTLMKRCQIYWVENELGLAVPVIYDIWRKDRPTEIRRFIEVEAEKGQPEETCQKLLEYWSAEFERVFGITEKDKNQLSLYEIYSGRRYIGA